MLLNGKHDEIIHESVKCCHEGVTNRGSLIIFYRKTNSGDKISKDCEVFDFEVFMTECPWCKRPIEANVTQCPHCGLPIKVASVGTTRGLGNTDVEPGTPRWGSAKVDSRTNLIIKVRDHEKTFVFDAATITELQIGRVNPSSGEVPEIDLSEYNAVEKGVSRRHATLVRKEGGAMHLVDKGSDNGTYLNGQKMIANQARILRDGDEIRLGFLVLTIKFERLN